MEPTTDNTSGKIIAALIIGLLVGFAAGVFWQARRSAGVISEQASATSAKGAKEETAAAASADKAIKFV